MCCWICKVSLACLIGHKLCIFYAFLNFVSKTIVNQKCLFDTILDPRFTKGVLSPLSVARPCVVCGPSLNILETIHCFFLIFCMKLEHHKGTKVTEPDFWKKILGGHKWGKNPFWGYFWCFLSISLHPLIKSFCNFIYIISSTLSNI